MIYSNPFARYDAALSPTPYKEPSHTLNLPLTILFNLTLIILLADDIWLICRVMRRSGNRKRM